MQKAKNLRKHLHTLWYAFKTSTSTAVREVSPLQKCFWQERRKFHQSPFCQDFVSLNNIADLPGARKQGRRVGRGIGSGRGKTSGRGHKGQKARTGRKVKADYEGGQSPLKEATPKRGFKNRFAINYTPLNLDRLKECLDSGRLPSDGVITMKDLRDSGTIQKRIRDGVKVLARGASSFNRKVHLQVTAVSDVAKQVIQQRGGTVTTVYYNKLGLRALVMPDWFEKKQRLLPRPAHPPPKKMGRHDVIGCLPPDRTIPSPTEIQTAQV